MKIYDSNMGGVPAGGTQRAQEAAPADRTSTGRVSSANSGDGDRIEFSGSLGRLSRILFGFQSDRSSRVATLAAQYQSGAYRPDSLGTGRAMIAEALGGTAETALQ